MLLPKDLQLISKTTLRHYDENAEAFWQGTKDHDVSQNYAAFLKAIKSEGPLKILDFGCGPGRDILYFKNLGHEAVGLDGSARFCEMAQALTHCAVLHQDFLSLKLKAEDFDGIFANAALFHIPRQELPRILRELHGALKASGILFSSNPRGNEEGWQGDRYGTYMEFTEYEKILGDAGFRVLEHYYRPKDKPRTEQPWLAVVSQKI